MINIHGKSVGTVFGIRLNSTTGFYWGEATILAIGTDSVVLAINGDSEYVAALPCGDFA